MPSAIVPLDRNAGSISLPAGVSGQPVAKPKFGYGVNPTDEVVKTGPARPITRMPKQDDDVQPEPKKGRIWDKVARFGRKAAWAAGAVATAGMGLFGLSALAGDTAAIIGGAVMLGGLLAPAAVVGAVGLAAWGIGKLAGRGAPPTPAPAPEPEAPARGWARVEEVGRKVAKAGTIGTSALLAAGLAAPLIATPFLLGAAAFAAAPVAAAGALMWGLGKLKAA